MKHILLPLMLLPAILFAQKHIATKTIKLPLYDAKLSITDSTNVFWVDSAVLRDSVLLEFDNPDIRIASFSMIISSKGEIFKVMGLGNTLPLQVKMFMSRAQITNAIITLHIEKIYLKGVLRTANWTYRVRVR